MYIHKVRVTVLKLRYFLFPSLLSNFFSTEIFSPESEIESQSFFRVVQ